MGMISTSRFIRAEHRALARVQPCRAQGQPGAAWASWVGRFCRAGASAINGKRVASEFGCGQPAGISSPYQQLGGQAFFGADRPLAQFNLIEGYPGDGVRNHGHSFVILFGDGHARQGAEYPCRNHRFALPSRVSEWFQRVGLIFNLTAFRLCGESFCLFGICSRGVSALDRGL